MTKKITKKSTANSKPKNNNDLEVEKKMQEQKNLKEEVPINWDGFRTKKTNTKALFKCRRKFV